MFLRLTPILPVADVAAELDFYELLGFERHVDPDEEYPLEEFAAVASGEHVLFGLARRDDPVTIPPVGLEWQFETTDVDRLSQVATEAGLEIVTPVTLQAWGRRLLTIRSPSGYRVTFEDV